MEGENGTKKILLGDLRPMALVVKRAAERFGGYRATARKALQLEGKTADWTEQERKEFDGLRLQLQRLARQERKSVRSDRLQLLERVIPAGDLKWALAVGRTRKASKQAYEQWLGSQTDRLDEPGAMLIYRALYRETHLTGSPSRKVGALTTEMFADLDVRRRLVAILRIVEPFLAWGASGGIERAAWELSAFDRQSYFKHASAAQAILLRRRGDVDRLQALSDPEVSARSLAQWLIGLDFDIDTDGARGLVDTWLAPSDGRSAPAEWIPPSGLAEMLQNVGNPLLSEIAAEVLGYTPIEPASPESQK